VPDDEDVWRVEEDGVLEGDTEADIAPGPDVAGTDEFILTIGVGLAV